MITPAVALAASSFFSSVASGISVYGAKTGQAYMQEAEGIVLESEAMREALRIEDEGERFADSQKMAYIGSGVEIGGSAVVTLAQTDKWARAEAEAVRLRGRNIRGYYGRAAQISRSQGRGAFISGISQGLVGAIGTYHMAKGVKTK